MPAVDPPLHGEDLLTAVTESMVALHERVERILVPRDQPRHQLPVRGLHAGGIGPRRHPLLQPHQDLLAVFLVTPVLGRFMSRVFARQRTWLDPVLRPVERLVYRLTGVDETYEQTVHARTSYRGDEIIWNARFRSAFGGESPSHLLSVDVSRLNDIENVR